VVCQVFKEKPASDVLCFVKDCGGVCPALALHKGKVQGKGRPKKKTQKE